MEEQRIVLQKKDNIASVTLNRPEKLNAMTLRMLQDLADALASADQDNETRVVVITGAGRAFCTGTDIAESLEARRNSQTSRSRKQYLNHTR